MDQRCLEVFFVNQVRLIYIYISGKGRNTGVARFLWLQLFFEYIYIYIFALSVFPFLFFGFCTYRVEVYYGISRPCKVYCPFFFCLCFFVLLAITSICIVLPRLFLFLLIPVTFSWCKMPRKGCYCSLLAYSL